MGTLSAQMRRERKGTDGGTLQEMSGTLIDSAGNPPDGGCCLPLREMAEKRGKSDFQQGNAEREKCEKHGLKELRHSRAYLQRKYISWIFGGGLWTGCLPPVWEIQTLFYGQKRNQRLPVPSYRLVFPAAE